jgi:flagellar basal-body rod modification protein FlgD
MTTTNPVSTPTTTTTTTTSNAQKQLSTNFDTFLSLLTTQLKNQDPTAPMDSTQFTQQLVQFSQVEQQINTNDNLKTLIGLSQGQSASQAMSYLGHNVVLTNGQGVLTGGAAKWTYGLSDQASTTTLTVSDANGKAVYSTSGDATAGVHDFAWTGKDSNGNQLPDGMYKLTVSSTANDGTAVTTSVASKGQVAGVDFAGSNPLLVIGSTEVPLASATLVTN